MRTIFTMLITTCLCAACDPTVPNSEAAVTDPQLTRTQPIPQQIPSPMPKPAPLSPATQNTTEESHSQELLPKINSTSATINHLTKSPISGLKPISTRSLSLKIYLKNGPNGVFKPMRKGNSTARYEVAYYRMAKFLGVEEVPQSTMRQIPLSKLQGHLSNGYPETASAITENVRTDNRGAVWGAMIEWMDHLEPSGIDGLGANRRLSKLLSTNPMHHSPLTPSISDMMVLDYITGNWDRFSGGNLFKIKSQNKLALIDNNGAFSNWSENQTKRMGKYLNLAQVFSKSLFEKIQTLNEENISTAMALPSWPGQLLTPNEIQLVLERRDALVRYINNLSQIHSKDKVISLP